MIIPEADKIMMLQKSDEKLKYIVDILEKDERGRTPEEKNFNRGYQKIWKSFIKKLKRTMK